jgi:hypothetical protein
LCCTVSVHHVGADGNSSAAALLVPSVHFGCIFAREPLPLGMVKDIDSTQLVRRVVDADGGKRMDPNPDYDVSDELQYGFAAFAWLLRGNYPPPYYGSD